MLPIAKIGLLNKESIMDELRLIDILAQFFIADPKSVKWDNSGSCDTITFTTSDKDKQRFLLKMAKDNVQSAKGNCLDFRVRVITM